MIIKSVPKGPVEPGALLYLYLFAAVNVTLN